MFSNFFYNFEQDVSIRFRSCWLSNWLVSLLLVDRLVAGFVSLIVRLLYWAYPLSVFYNFKVLDMYHFKVFPLDLSCLSMLEM